MKDESTFPQIEKVGEIARSEGGLTKREVFALIGMIVVNEAAIGSKREVHPEDFAREVFVLADAMLAEAEKERTP